MPRAAVYWKNPQKERDASNERRRRLYAAGATKKLYLSPAALAKWRKYNREYSRTHRAGNIIACRKYRAKLIRLFGTSQQRATWQYHMLLETKKLKIRKARAKCL